VALLELADPAALRPGEGAALVAKQLALQERLGMAAQLIARNGWSARLLCW